MEPSSPKAPSSAPTESSSPSESAKNAPSGHQAQLVAVKMTRNRQFQECSGPASSPPSLGQSTGSDSDSLPTSSPAQASAPRGDVFPAAPTTPFRFPGSRRNSNTNTNSSTAVAQTQQTQATVEPPNTSNCYFAYCLDRGNGLYTRLVPADTLPASVGYAPLQSDSRGMIVLQDPLTKGFSGVPSPLSLGGVAAGNSLPTFSARPVQQLNFTAYAAAQVTPFAQRAGLANTNASPAKKNKVYCDKWVHEGICAFTQQGCKFKHEMPHDRNIQRSLGLFHGYPNWYKKLQAQESQQTTTDTATASPPLALPAPPGIGKQQAPALLAHTTGFTPGLFTSTQSSLVCPVSVVSVPTAPPPTPLPQQASLYQPCYPSFAVAVAGSRLRGNSVSSIDGPWRATGVNAPSWRTQHANSTADNINANVNPSSFTSVPLADSSTAQLTDNFVHSLGINEPLGPVHPNQQQQTAPLPVPVAANTMDAFLPTMTIPTDTYPVGFGLGFSRGRGGSLGAVDNELADSFLESTSSGSNKSVRGAFGPIGPPSRATQETTDASGAFSFRGSQTFSSNQQPGEDEKSNHRDEEW
ncbi:hypothetical protein SEUCBS140593_002644 [Sporothrix eucalyptigena]|uniref:C3H1-type domain-containing protein n=1 Tax=Sporothrix eucalyptigena TaxID=1812306 RepID=A0ABP0B8E0_9PEZI